MNMQGGGGLEIWQYMDRNPHSPPQPPIFGQPGLFAARIKCRDVTSAYHILRKNGVEVLSPPIEGINGQLHFYVRDPFDNIFDMVGATDWFHSTGSPTGGCAGAVIGVRNMDMALRLYRDILGYDEILAEKKGRPSDVELSGLGNSVCHRLLIGHRNRRTGGFARLLGDTQLELVQLESSSQEHIFHGRYWGDLGVIHLCFDVKGMAALKKTCAAAELPFVVDSSDSFDMGTAAGHFAYVQDPDGTLIELVETHRLPLVKKLGWHLDLRNRKPDRDLPKWLVGLMRFNRTRSN